MLPQWTIEKKRDGHALTPDEIRTFIAKFTTGDIPDYQMAALAMAIYLKGMTPEETSVLVDAMMRSGDLVDTSSIPLPKADKHSTGGIGDKVSLILAPLAAVLGVAVPMISGRGLGITGGTLDKLESIPGYRTDLSEPEFIEVIKKCGCSIIGQTARLAPADKKLYALRDVTGTVPSIPLITASIMCKKMAEGIDALVLDVKCGSGAFMKTLDDARTLAKSMVDVGNAMGKKVSALITDMNQPLGHTAGNALEVVESIETLQGKGPQDLTDLTVALTVEMVVLSFPDRDPVDIEKQARAALEDGTAFAKFKEMAALQGADTATLDDPSRLAKATLIEPFPAPADGWVSSVSADKVGRACLILGAGRAKTDDVVDFAVGISGLAKIGQIVAKGDPLAVIHANHPEKLAEAKAMLEGFAGISSTAVTPPPLILEHLAAHA